MSLFAPLDDTERHSAVNGNDVAGRRLSISYGSGFTDRRASLPYTNGHTNGQEKVKPVKPPMAPGIYVPTVAFFERQTEELDTATIEKHATRLARAGVTGLVTHGSNGEAVHLSHSERMTVTSVTRRALDLANYPEMCIIVGCGAQSTRETIRLCQEAHESGGDYALVLPPSYYRTLLTPQMLLDYFLAVADASPIPLVIYNFPGATSGLDLDSEQITALSRHRNIAAVKLTCGNTGKLARIAHAADPGFLTMGGSADFIVQSLVVGGHGVIAGLANLAPKACVRVMELYNKGDIEGARAMQAIVADGDWATIKGGFVAVKSALETFYDYGGAPRKPCAASASKQREALRAELSELMQLEMSL